LTEVSVCGSRMSARVNAVRASTVSAEMPRAATVSISVAIL